eukprot:scaffold1970_cov396-Prasinococcus_capsulatus_cf.AAC.39
MKLAAITPSTGVLKKIKLYQSKVPASGARPLCDRQGASFSNALPFRLFCHSSVRLRLNLYLCTRLRDALTPSSTGAVRLPTPALHRRGSRQCEAPALGRRAGQRCRAASTSLTGAVKMVAVGRPPVTHVGPPAGPSRDPNPKSQANSITDRVAEGDQTDPCQGSV